MAEQQERTDLGDLVRTRRAELGISLRELEARSIDPASREQAKFGWIAKLENRKPTKAPSAEQLAALAAGLQLPVRIVQEAAAAQYLGMVWSEDRTARVLVARLDELSDADRAEITEIAEMYARRRRGQQ